MSEIPAVRGTAEAQLPPEPHATPKREEGDEPRPRKRKPAGARQTEPEAHQLDVEA
jgi:hypothetical protein